ncbi:MAG: putative two-component system response regulator [Acidobacteria bacterium]|nr:putative two-component system response regulator [Acidobacteriota bacterium]
MAAPPVVIVEDDADTLELYSLSLEAAGYDVRPARTAGRAIELVRAVRPRVVVTDLTLPDLAGVPLCEALSEAGRSDLGALIVVSGSADERVLSGVRAAGAREILVKPCLPTELEAAIRRALR